MAKRKPLGKKTRFEVFKRDGFTCAYCGAQPPSVVLHCDHVVPVAEGGGNDIDNLVTACDACNLGKGATPLSAVPKTMAEKTEELREREEQIVAFHELLAQKRDRIEDDAWVVARMFNAAWGADPGQFSESWFTSIERFVEQLPLEAITDAAKIAIAKKPYSESQAFRYFCGVCWNKIRDGSHG